MQAELFERPEDYTINYDSPFAWQDLPSHSVSWDMQNRLRDVFSAHRYTEAYMERHMPRLLENRVRPVHLFQPTFIPYGGDPYVEINDSLGNFNYRISLATGRVLDQFTQEREDHPPMESA